MSGLPPSSDVFGAGRHFAFGPEADVTAGHFIQPLEQHRVQTTTLALLLSRLITFDQHHAYICGLLAELD